MPSLVPLVVCMRDSKGDPSGSRAFMDAVRELGASSFSGRPVVGVLFDPDEMIEEPGRAGVAVSAAGSWEVCPRDQEPAFWISIYYGFHVMLDGPPPTSVDTGVYELAPWLRVAIAESEVLPSQKIERPRVGQAPPEAACQRALGDAPSQFPRRRWV